ncbi:MAG: PilT/PilU family type 4a pilus ATPase [Gammaproteobacteria bacterium]|nr:PilT/PilU family type 4a pilus ATPase [Gammaproteobacteria bacterium]
MARINAFLQLGREQRCSDIHLAVGSPPLLRIMGDLVPIKYRELSETELHDLLYEILTDEQKSTLESGDDLDFSYQDEELGRFRVSIYRKLGGLGASFRVIALQIPSLSDLGLPAVVEKMLNIQHGLILVTGATGTGKTTTLAAMINLINNTRRLNIITLEDPVEYLYKSNMSLVIQREVGSQVESFAMGLRAALREDPDVILVGELRDPETISLAMTAAETGHLVLGTLHTSSAMKTMDRIIDAMPTEQKHQAVTFLAHNLRGVISQKLIKTANNRELKAITEILVNTPAISNLIMNGKMHQIPSMLQTGANKGMQLMDQALMEALNKKEIDPDDAYKHATDKSIFQAFVTNPEILPQLNINVS